MFYINDYRVRRGIYRESTSLVVLHIWLTSLKLTLGKETQNILIYGPNKKYS